MTDARALAAKLVAAHGETFAERAGVRLVDEPATLWQLLVVAQFDGTVGDVAAPIAWAFVIWGVTLYWLAGLLYAVQVREMVNAVRAPQAAR